MPTVLFILLVVSIGIAVTASWLYWSVRQSLHRYQGIRDIEKHKSDCKQQADVALKEVERLTSLYKTNQSQILEQQTKIRNYFKVLGNLKSATELEQKIREDQAKVQQLATVLGNLKTAVQLKDFIANQQAIIAQRTQELDELAASIGSAKTVGEIAAQARYFENYLSQLKSDIEAVEEAGELQQFGFYRARYDFDNSDKYKQRLEQVRTKQKQMLKSKTACTCEVDWHVDGDRKKGRKMVDQQVALMLRAFNGESDAAVAKVRYNNVVALENRVKKSYEAVNKLGETQKSRLNYDYVKLKFEELQLAHEYQEKKQEEKELQAELRERMREDEKAIREIEEAQEAAEQDEAIKLKALEKAREEMSHKTGQQLAKFEALVSKLELELKDAIDRKAKAIARAQLTRSGHVYILSNIGTFGDGVFKIGLTRRLEPLERVKELGGASVPFPFDVHAMIFCEDAPTLENILHKHFANRRVNMVNLRREFFRVTLDEIRAAVAQHHGQVTFMLVPEAEEFRKTQALVREASKNPPQLQTA